MNIASRVTRTVVLCTLVSTGSASAEVAVPATVRFPSLPAVGTMRVFPLEADVPLANRVRSKFERDAAASADVSIFADVGPTPSFNGANPAAARAAARNFFVDVFGPSADAFTHHELPDPLVVARQRVQSNGLRGDVIRDSSWFRATRFVGEFPVYGPGSIATLEVRGQDIVSAVFRWDKVVGDPQEQPLIALNEALLKAAVEREIPDARFILVDVVSSPELVYYDDRHALFPAYRVVLNVNRLDGATPDRIDIFIPAVARPPADPPPTGGFAVECSMPIASNPPGVRLDRYVLNTDSSGWELNGRRFVASFTPQNTTVALRHFCFLESSMLCASKASFIDSSHIALIETHGLPGRIQTIGSGKRLEWFDLACAGGYGAQTESLRLLILHSCEVVRTADDDKSGWDAPWQKVFTGLHTVLGYRTVMKISDGVSAAYAVHLNANEPMIRSWFAEVANAYRNDQGRGGTRSSGRGAAITVCGNEQAKPSQLAALPSPTCLESFWFRD